MAHRETFGCSPWWHPRSCHHVGTCLAPLFPSLTVSEEWTWGEWAPAWLLKVEVSAVPLWYGSSCHPRPPSELGLLNFFLLVVKWRVFITWISFHELLAIVYICFQSTKLKSSWCCCCGRLLSGFFQSLRGLFANGGKEPFQYYFDFVFQVRLLR